MVVHSRRTPSSPSRSPPPCATRASLPAHRRSPANCSAQPPPFATRISNLVGRRAKPAAPPIAVRPSPPSRIYLALARAGRAPLRPLARLVVPSLRQLRARAAGAHSSPPPTAIAPPPFPTRTGADPPLSTLNRRGQQLQKMEKKELQPWSSTPAAHAIVAAAPVAASPPPPARSARSPSQPASCSAQPPPFATRISNLAAGKPAAPPIAVRPSPPSRIYLALARAPPPPARFAQLVVPSCCSASRKSRRSSFVAATTAIAPPPFPTRTGAGSGLSQP
ncbi:proline-rich protein 36-like [Eucalyptus grandis]|uniref:proline-rich protein 36-like n=1 Tax=Eucalyptus grandis TaxID=71139 RepID=UPI00192E82CB|nr:proline-rich protein 36-like [Eucalyptus grandis]